MFGFLEKVIGSDSRPLASQVHRHLVPCFLAAVVPTPILHPVPCSVPVHIHASLLPSLPQVMTLSKIPFLLPHHLIQHQGPFKPYLLQATFLKYILSLKHFIRGQKNHGNRSTQSGPGWKTVSLGNNGSYKPITSGSNLHVHLTLFIPRRP